MKEAPLLWYWRTRPLRPRLPLRPIEDEVAERLVSVGDAFFERSLTADPGPCALLCDVANAVSAIVSVATRLLDAKRRSKALR